MCNRVECNLIRKRLETMDNIRESERQLNKCQKCAYKKEVEFWKDKTYLQARKTYVNLYWKKVNNKH